ncbi:MAG TPA: serine/threonine-protein kinase, partial [Polyangiaceae bacterium]|nr:serine/threonine-protein kinase [Polyangiaceae bacterium]
MPESWKEDDAEVAGAAPAAEGVLAPGTLIDQFRIMRLLATGGMGELYLARDVRLGRKVALKCVQPSLLGSEEAVGRFLAEARTTAKFSHPNIVTVYTVGEHDGKPYLALEYLEGENLRDRLGGDHRGLSLNEALRLLMAVAEALAEAHQHGVLHRDLKPENVVIPKDGRVRVVDFGLASRVTEQEEKPEERLTSASFQSTTLVRIEAPSGRAGTPQYMAPEQWHALECTAQTDVWALGVILFELCTGQLPFDEPTMFKQAMAVCGAEPAPRAEAIADVPREIADLIARCLEKSSDQRPDATSVARALRAMVERERVKLSDEESPFRGLLPFGEQHAHLFFGRDAELAAF